MRMIPAVLVAALVTTGCGSGTAGTAGTAPAPARPGTAAPTARPDPKAGDCCFAQGLEIARKHRVARLTTRRFTQSEYWALLRPVLASPRFKTEEIGKSVQGRTLTAISLGTGPVKVLMWSQMHGDESAASMGLLDFFTWVAAPGDDPVRDRLLAAVSLTVVPMLNPDGAELFQRHNALGVDVNRDARRLSTPEARALKALHDRLKPAFGFNLHDQNARTTAGPNGKQVGIALLAPAISEDGRYDAVRTRARLVAARLATRLEQEIPGQVARYDDSFNPRAFGDLVQTWGTSTVLIESGALAGDPEKQRLRALNTAGLIDALVAIGEGTYRQASARAYESLQENQSIALDVLVRGAKVVGLGPEEYLLDVGITYGDAVQKTNPRVSEVGDLSAAAALDTIDATGLFLHPEPAMVTVQEGKRFLRIGNAAQFTLRRGSAASSERVPLWTARP